MINIKRVYILLFLFITVLSHGQDEIWIKPNKGQWHENVEYKIDIPGGIMYLEDDGFTYYMHNFSELIHHHNEGEESHEDENFKSHTVKTKFIGSNDDIKFENFGKSAHYENYFLGNDSTKWVSNLFLFQEIKYKELYDGIDLHLYESERTLKYDIHIAPNADINNYKVSYTGMDSLVLLENKSLAIHTRFGEIIESKPFTYQIINGIKRIVECDYKLNGDTLSFHFPKDYNHQFELIIDPILSFSTFTGSTSDNWGMTATPDINGKLIAGGAVFGGGYPTGSTQGVGVYDATFNGGDTDLGITKFNLNGSNIEFSTYIGGGGSETPHSCIVNGSNQIYIMGATSSIGFPITPGAFQQNHNGGTGNVIDGISFNGGIDLFIVKLSQNGDIMLNSTYFGGSGDDGISNPNNNTSVGKDIAYNYGDQLRGEIIVDDLSNVYITSTTVSSNIPINGSAASSSLSGVQDAIVAKFNTSLTVCNYSSYIGGSGYESGNSLQVSSTGDLFIVGGTTSSNFPFTSGQLNSNYQGGATDGYILKLSAPNYTNPKSTYLGTNQYDQAFIVQLDLLDKVYVYGQSEGNYPVTPGVYSNPNSGQFIHKLNNNLTVSEWSSVFGGGNNTVELSPTAFLVSDCYKIYVAGWGGSLNNLYGSTSNSTTSGFPVTFDAYDNTTTGNNFWIGVFEPDMVALEYGTFMGSNNVNDNDHVDGGTSRFSKDGKVYHAVCAACGGGSFPTTPGVYSPTNGYPQNCNMAAFVFELNQLDATLSTATPVTCLPNATVFTNASINGNVYQWYFGDGDSSNVFSPSHLYPGPGFYTVTLIVSDINGCFTPDTAYIDVEIIQPIYDAYSLEDTICPGETVQVFASGGTGYSWGPPGLFNNPFIANPFATITTDTTLTVTITDACGTTDLDVIVKVFETNVSVSNDTIICVGQSIPIEAFGGVTYSWEPANTVSNPIISNPIATPTSFTFYVATVTTEDGCIVKDSLLVLVDQGLANPNLSDDLVICKGSSAQLNANGANSYNWYPASYISSISINNPSVNPLISTMYYVDFINACGTITDSVFIEVNKVTALTRGDTAVCPGEPIGVWASGGITYRWVPPTKVENPNAGSTIIRPVKTTEYVVGVTNEFGCTDSARFEVVVFDLPQLIVSPDAYAVKGDLVPIWAEGVGDLIWVPGAFTTCPTCFNTTVFPPVNTNYTAILTDHNGCKVQDDVAIFYDPLIYVPNIFTPDANDYNNVFRPITQNISEFEMVIYNRWGELVFQSFNTGSYWDGRYGGSLAQDGTYVWVIKYVDLNGVKGEVKGHVSLLR